MIFIFDDFIYSGTKIKQQLDNIYENYTYIKNKPFPNIHICVVGITNESLKYLEKLSAKFNREIKKLSWIKNPVKFHSVLNVKSLHEILSEKDLMRIFN